MCGLIGIYTRQSLLGLLFLMLPVLAYAEDCSRPADPNLSFTPTEPRIALIIGNADYQNLPTTPNAKNDASDLSKTLSGLGFEVICGTNLSRAEFTSKLEQYSNRINQMGSTAVGLFYYAGHGVQLDSKNYLIPLGADLSQADSFEDEAVNLDVVMKTMMESGDPRSSKFIVLDACRDNPLGKGWGKPKASYSIKNMFWTFGTGYGNYAYDGGGRNGLFTKHLLANIHTPGATFEQVMKRVTAAVDHESGGDQTPETGGSSLRDFMFVPGERVSVVTTYEDTPIWLKALYWLAVVLLFVGGYFFHTHKQKTAWTKGIDLTSKLEIDPKVAEEVRRKSRLATNEIVGYVKNIKNGKLMAIITPNYDMILGRNNNVNIVIDDNDAVSGEHAQLGWDKDKKEFWLEDLGSTNGTWWGKSKQLEENTRYPLESGQLFYLADQESPMVVLAHIDE